MLDQIFLETDELAKIVPGQTRGKIFSIKKHEIKKTLDFKIYLVKFKVNFCQFNVRLQQSY